MFKRAPKLEPPPAPPKLQEILEDLETFEIKKPPTVPVRDFDPSSGNLESEWWKVFETFLSDVDELKKIRTELNGYKIQLEMETTSKNIQNEIDDHIEETRKQFIDD